MLVAVSPRNPASFVCLFEMAATGLRMNCTYSSEMTNFNTLLRVMELPGLC